MSARSASLPRTHDARLILGVAALIVGMGMFASGLSGRDGDWDIAADGMPRTRTVISDRGLNHAFSGMEARPMVYTPHETDRTGRLDEQIPRVEPVEWNRAGLAKATARWAATWYRAVSSDTVRADLVSAAAERWTTRWRRAILSWDDPNGSGSVEPSRASAEVHGEPTADESQGSGGVRWAPADWASGALAAWRGLRASDLASSRSFLRSPAMAAAKAWDATSGYGSVEASRAERAMNPSLWRAGGVE